MGDSVWYCACAVSRDLSPGKITHIFEIPDPNFGLFHWLVSSPLQHSRITVPECCKNEKASQQKKKSAHRLAKTPESISTVIGIGDYVLDGTRHAKFCSDRFWSFCFPNTWLCRASGVTSFLFVSLGFSITPQPTPLNGFLRKIRQMTSFWIRKCLLWVPMTISRGLY